MLLGCRTLTFCQLIGVFSLNHSKVKLLAGEQEATECMFAQLLPLPKSEGSLVSLVATSRAPRPLLRAEAAGLVGEGTSWMSVPFFGSHPGRSKDCSCKWAMS